VVPISTTFGLVSAIGLLYASTHFTLMVCGRNPVDVHRAMSLAVPPSSRGLVAVTLGIDGRTENNRSFYKFIRTLLIVIIIHIVT